MSSNNEGGVSGGGTSNSSMNNASSVIKDPLSYPIIGLTYLLAHPSMFCNIIGWAILAICLSIAILIILFMLTLRLQVMNVFGGGKWYSWILGVIAVLIEATILAIILLKVVLSKVKRDLFVTTMKNQNKWNPTTMTIPSITNDILNFCKLGTLIGLMTLPLNLFPPFGIVAYAFINGPFVGWDYMDMYMEAIGLDPTQQRIAQLGHPTRSKCSPMIYVFSNSYTRFGFTATLLEIIPVAGPAFFALTNVVGAALWACDMENNGGPVANVLVDSKDLSSSSPSTAYVSSTTTQQQQHEEQQQESQPSSTLSSYQNPEISVKVM